MLAACSLDYSSVDHEDGSGTSCGLLRNYNAFSPHDRTATAITTNNQTTIIIVSNTFTVAGVFFSLT
jgi:hypothetical protein